MSVKRIYCQVYITEVLLDMIIEIILAIMAFIFLVIGIFLFKGKATWLIAGYNSLSEEEKNKYDKKAICKAAGFICFVCCVILCVIAYIAHKANSDMIDETSIITASVVLLAILIIAIITVGLHFTKRNRKKTERQ